MLQIILLLRCTTNDRAFKTPTWFIRILGIFIPFMKEMPEMMYQYEQDYFFDSSKFTKRFGMEATSYQIGVQNIVNQG
jgi:hypothetical protein